MLCVAPADSIANLSPIIGSLLWHRRDDSVTGDAFHLNVMNKLLQSSIPIWQACPGSVKTLDMIRAAWCVLFINVNNTRVIGLTIFPQKYLIYICRRQYSCHRRAIFYSQLSPRHISYSSSAKFPPYSVHLMVSHYTLLSHDSPAIPYHPAVRLYIIFCSCSLNIVPCLHQFRITLPFGAVTTGTAVKYKKKNKAKCYEWIKLKNCCIWCLLPAFSPLREENPLCCCC